MKQCLRKNYFMNEKSFKTVLKSASLCTENLIYANLRIILLKIIIYTI